MNNIWSCNKCGDGCVFIMGGNLRPTTVITNNKCPASLKDEQKADWKHCIK